MRENAADLIERSNHVASKMMVNGSAFAASVSPPDMFGQFLNTHGIAFLSYAEIMKIIGCIWITMLAIEFIVKYVKKWIMFFKKKKAKVCEDKTNHP